MKSIKEYIIYNNICENKGVRRVNKTASKSVKDFENFKFDNVKIGKQCLPFVNYGYETADDSPYLWNEVNVVWVSENDEREDVIVISINNEHSAWYFNNDEGFKTLTDDAETIAEAFEAENISTKNLPSKIGEQENFTNSHLNELCYK